jgi:hypothetical protein
MKPLKIKYFVVVHELVAGTRASALAEIFVCFIRSPRSTAPGHGRVTDNMIDL